MAQFLNAKCPVCKSLEHEALMTVVNAPVSCGQVYGSVQAAAESGRCRLEIILCPSCGHIWNSAYGDGPDTDYGDDYYSSKTVSSQARDYQEALAKDIDELVQLVGKTVVEIGCGDGFFLNSLKTLGAKAIGFEPSSTYHISKKLNGIQVHHQYFGFDGASRHTTPEADVVVLRHVLEHLGSPGDVLASLRSDCFDHPGPEFLFLEVPNSAKLLADSLYFDFYNDHIQYFSSPSLTRLARSAGWLPLARIGSSDEFLRLVFLNPDRNQQQRVTAEPPDELEGIAAAANRFRQGFGQWKDQLADIITGYKESGCRIAVWGAGSRGVSLLAGLGLAGDCYEYVVDTDPNKHGKYLPLIPRPIYAPEQLRLEPVECVLVTSYTYFDEILAELEWFRSQGGKVVRVYPAPEAV